MNFFFSKDGRENLRLEETIIAIKTSPSLFFFQFLSVFAAEQAIGRREKLIPFVFATLERFRNLHLIDASERPTPKKLAWMGMQSNGPRSAGAQAYSLGGGAVSLHLILSMKQHACFRRVFTFLFQSTCPRPTRCESGNCVHRSVFPFLHKDSTGLALRTKVFL